MLNRCMNLWLCTAACVVAFWPGSSQGQETEDRPAAVEYQQLPVTEYRLIEEAIIDLKHTAQERLWTGMQLAAVDPALRSQLDLADDKGVVVVNVDSDSPADEAGIEAHDILLTVGGEPVRDEATLRERIGASGGEVVSVVLLRGGKRLSVELTPRPREWEVVTFAIENQYRIGVRVAAMDESLRSQLGLSEGRGLVVTEVIKESPAAKAGIEQHDILLEFGGKPLRTTEDLTSQVQEVGDRAATMELIRKGERQSVRVTPERHSVEPLVNFVEVEFTPIDVLLPTIDGVVESVVEPSQDETTEARLQQLIREMEALTERMEALQQSLRTPAENEAGAGEADPDGGGEAE